MDILIEGYGEFCGIAFQKILLETAVPTEEDFNKLLKSSSNVSIND
jgi:hypothetical protein